MSFDDFREEIVNQKFTFHLTKLLSQLTKDSYNNEENGVEYDLINKGVFNPNITIYTMLMEQEMEQSLEPSIDPAEILPTTWDSKLARIISDVISPPVVTILGAMFFAMAIDTWSSRIWTGLYVFVVMAIPTLYIMWLVKRGLVTDFHLRVREQRLKPNLMIAGCAIAGWLLLLAGAAPYPLVVLAGIGVIQTTSLLVITTKWKISGHSMGIASFAVLVWSLYGVAAFPVLFTIPLVAWARLRLKRHTLLQTVAGALMGIGFMAFILYLISNHCGGTGYICG